MGDVPNIIIPNVLTLNPSPSKENEMGLLGSANKMYRGILYRNSPAGHVCLFDRYSTGQGHEDKKYRQFRQVKS